MADYKDQSEHNAPSIGNNALIQNVPYLYKLQDVFQEVEQKYWRAMQQDDQDSIQNQCTNLHSLF